MFTSKEDWTNWTKKNFN